MKKILVATLVGVCLTTGGFAQDAPKVLRLEEDLKAGELLVVGEAETIHFPGLDIGWPARIDTGATTTSIHAVNIEEFERDGKPWARFQLRNDETDETIDLERAVERIAEIRKRGADGTHSRPVILMDVALGDIERRIEVNLTDRSGFDFPVLIGRNFLSGTAIVDVSRAYVHGESGGD